jgi:hypothetical protein
MKKIRQRKAMAALMALGIVLLFLGVYGAWSGATHVGPGVWTFGGDEPGTGGALGTDEHQEVIQQDEYRRQYYACAVMFFALGGVLLYGSRKDWKARDKLEKEQNELAKAWELTISNPENVQKMQQHPELYRDDFKQWIKENHPELSQQPNRHA